VEVKVLVTVALKLVVEEATVLATSVVIVVVTTCVELVVTFATICSGHSWKDEVALFHQTSIPNRRYPMLNKSERAVMFATV
jgi:hypothetical protein